MDLGPPWTNFFYSPFSDKPKGVAHLFLLFWTNARGVLFSLHLHVFNLHHCTRFLLPPFLQKSSVIADASHSEVTFSASPPSFVLADIDNREPTGLLGSLIFLLKSVLGFTLQWPVSNILTNSIDFRLQFLNHRLEVWIVAPISGSSLSIHLWNCKNRTVWIICFASKNRTELLHFSHFLYFLTSCNFYRL